MSVADVAAVDAALVGLLAADAELATLLPDGVFLDVAPAGKTRFAIVQHQTHHDEDAFRMTVYEEFRYRITARVRETSGVDANAAAYRIHTLLQDVDIEGLDGYTHMATLRVERIKFPEVDAIDNDIRWQIAGGDYEITVSPGDPVPPPGPAYADLVIADGASHYWRLGEAGGTIAVDSVGFAHGTISGGVTLNQPGALTDGDKAMAFNGTTGKIVTASTVIPVVSTLEAWIRIAAGGTKAFLSTRNSGQSGDTFALGTFDPGRVFLSSSGFLSTTGVLDHNQWHHVVVIQNASTASFYLNGQFDNTQAQVRAVANSGNIGISWDEFGGAGTQFFPGSLDDIAIYPHALTPAQIAAHYTAATTARRSSRTRTRKD